MNVRAKKVLGAGLILALSFLSASRRPVDRPRRKRSRPRWSG